MASNSDEASRGTEDSSEEESLATLKRKADYNEDIEDDRRRRTDEDSDDEGLLPGICVKVEVEEVDNPDSATANLNDESASRERPKRKTRPQRVTVDPDYVTDWRPPKRKKHTSCPDCSKVFENATDMKKHSIEHQVQTRHKCDECGRCFSKAFGLKTHKRMHGERNQHCPLCEASFTLAINLNGVRPEEQQKVRLVEFLQCNRDARKGVYSDRSAKMAGMEKWASVAEDLNCCGVAKKDGKGWSKYWTEKKHHLKKIYAQNETSKLTDTDKRMVALIYDEFNHSLETTAVQSSDSDVSDSNSDESTEKSPPIVAQSCTCDKNKATEEALVRNDELNVKSTDITPCDVDGTAKAATIAILDASIEIPSETGTRPNQHESSVKQNVTYMRSGPTNRPSRNQLKKLVKLLQRNPELAKGQIKTAPGRFEARKKWASWAKRLNALGGARKDGRGWLKFWIEKKCYLKRVCAKRETWKLTPLYVKMVALLDDHAAILSQLEEKVALGESNDSSEESVESESVSDLDTTDGDNDLEMEVATRKYGNRPTHTQMMKLVEFLECNPEIVKCATMNTQARMETKRKWEVLAERLNALGEHVQKDGRGWSKYWVERKCYIKKALIQQESSKLSALERRLAPLLGYEVAPSHPSTSEDEDVTKIAKEGANTEIPKENTVFERDFLDAETPKTTVKLSEDPPSTVNQSEEEKIVPNSVRPSRLQLEALVEFLEKYPEIANGSVKRMVDRIRANRKWARVTMKLNTLGLSCKDRPGWVKYWVEKKCFIKKMCQMKWLSRLTDLEIRLARVLGYCIEEAEDAEQGKHYVLKGKRVDPPKKEEDKLPVTVEFAPSPDTSYLNASEEEETSTDKEKGDSVLQVCTVREGPVIKVESENSQDPLSVHAVLIKEERFELKQTPFESVAVQSETECKPQVLHEKRPQRKTKLETKEKSTSVKSKGLAAPEHIAGKPFVGSDFIRRDHTKKQLNSSQVQALIEFMQSTSELDRLEVQDRWTDMAAKLNELGGVRKSRRGWMNFWKKKKHHLETVCAQSEGSLVKALTRKRMALICGETVESPPEADEDARTYKSRKRDNRTRTISTRPSRSQLDKLIHFLKQNPGIAKAQLRTAQGRMESKKKWAALAKRLNALDGVRKDGRGWSKYWLEKKCLLKKACAKNENAKLSITDKKMLALVDEDANAETQKANQTVLEKNDELSDEVQEVEAASDESDSKESSDEENEGPTATSKQSGSRRPNHSQMMKLVEFLESNPVIVNQRARYLRARTMIKASWAAVAASLNALGTVKKDGHGWAKFWTEKKCYLKKVCAQRDTARLSVMEKRLVALMDGDSDLSTAPSASLYASTRRSTSNKEHEELTQKDNMIAEKREPDAELTRTAFTEDDRVLLQKFFSSVNQSEEAPKLMSGPPNALSKTSNLVETVNSQKQIDNDSLSDENDAQDSSDSVDIPKSSVKCSEKPSGANSCRPSLRQIEGLLLFLEKNPDIASGRLRGAHNVEGKWSRLANRLNSLGEARKDMRGWIKYWTEKKCYIKKVFKMKWWSRLSDFDVRLAALIGYSIEAVEDAERDSFWTVNEKEDCTDPDSVKIRKDKEQRRAEDSDASDISGSENTPKSSVKRSEETPKCTSDPVQAVNSSRPSNRQIECLVKFLERHPDIANCRLRGELYLTHNVEGKWNRLTDRINSLGEAHRDRRAWMKYWAEKKSYINKMCKMKWWSRLSELDLRLAAVIGYSVEATEDAEQGKFLILKDKKDCTNRRGLADKAVGSSDEEQGTVEEESDESDVSDSDQPPKSTMEDPPKCTSDRNFNSSRPSQRQLEGLVMFLEQYPFLANNSRGLTGEIRRSLDVEGRWNRFANEINAPGEACKDGRGWNKGRHMMYHHKRMKCEHCEAFYETKEQLYEHKVAVHPEHPAIPPDVPRKPRSWSTYKIKKKSEETEQKSTPSKNESKATDGDSDDSEEVNDSVDQDDTDPLDEGNGESNFDVYTKKEDVPYPIQCAIVSKMHKGRSVSDICQIYNLTAEVINEIWEDRDEFVILKRAGRKSTKYMNSVLDRRILDWLNYQKQNDIQVTGKMLMDIAESFAKENGFVAFNGSKKWLDRFKTRYKITFRSTVRRKRVFSANPNESKWKKQFLEEQWLDARNGFNDEEIYTGDEVGVYYNSSRGRIKKMAGKKYIHGLPKDRLSIFMCTNVTGSDKKKLLVCGTEDPLIHSFRNPDTLPVTYIRHAQGHFTTPMFEEYVKFWNKELQLLNRKAVLILDRATIHSKLTLSHLKLVFVPWKAAQSLMPIKNGIFNKFRDEYRRLLVQEKAMNAVRRIDRKLTSLEALNLLEKAWDRTPSEAIANCFAFTGYDVKNNYVHKHVVVPKVTEDDETALCKMLSDFDVDAYYQDTQALDNYITVDEEFLTGHGSNGSVFGGNHKAIDPAIRRKEIEEILPLATERPETDEVESQVMRSRALEDLEVVRRYLQANVTDYEVYTKFMDVERFVLRSVANF